MAEENTFSISSHMETYSLGQTPCRCNSDFIQHMNYLKTGHLSTSWHPSHSTDIANHDVLLSASQHLWSVCTKWKINKIYNKNVSKTKIRFRLHWQSQVGISRNNQPNLICCHWLSVSGNSETLHSGILINKPYLLIIDVIIHCITQISYDCYIG